jgi:putative Mg2+ transporter-C (MgtC) family protein
MFGVWTDSLDHLVHLLVAFILALPIGWNRGRVERGAGIRTFPLVAMASCGFVQTATSVLGAGAITQANVLQCASQVCGCDNAGSDIDADTQAEIAKLNAQQEQLEITPQCQINGTLCGAQTP